MVSLDDPLPPVVAGSIQQFGRAEMAGSADNPVEVLAGAAQAGLRWSVVVFGDSENLYTLLRVYREDRLLVPGSGFGGPSLPAGSAVSEWRGRTDDLPYFVMARTLPDVDRVVATTNQGLEVELAISAPSPEFGLRFAAAALPDGHAPSRLRVERGGIVLQTCPQPMGRSREAE